MRQRASCHRAPVTQPTVSSEGVAALRHPRQGYAPRCHRARSGRCAHSVRVSRMHRCSERPWARFLDCRKRQGRGGSLTATMACLSSARVDPHDRVLRRQQLPQPRKPGVAVAITPGQAATSLMDVLLDALGYQARQPHQEDVFTSSTDAHEELLAGATIGGRPKLPASQRWLQRLMWLF
jgi:hypothetical protein